MKSTYNLKLYWKYVRSFRDKKMKNLDKSDFSKKEWRLIKSRSLKGARKEVGKVLKQYRSDKAKLDKLKLDPKKNLLKIRKLEQKMAQKGLGQALHKWGVTESDFDALHGTS